MTKLDHFEQIVLSGMCSTYVFVMKDLQLGVTVWWGPGEVSYLPVSNFAAPMMKIVFSSIQIQSPFLIFPHGSSRFPTGAPGAFHFPTFAPKVPHGNPY